jgi:hypothetical protein
MSVIVLCPPVAAFSYQNFHKAGEATADER